MDGFFDFNDAPLQDPYAILTALDANLEAIWNDAPGPAVPPTQTPQLPTGAAPSPPVQPTVNTSTDKEEIRRKVMAVKAEAGPPSTRTPAPPETGAPAADSDDLDRALAAARQEEATRQEGKVEAEPVDLDDFVLNGLSEEMEKQMLDDKMVLGNIAILGQATVIYAKPGTGKTLLTIWLLIEKIKSGEIRGADVYYIDADDHYKGLVQKTKLAEQHGFKIMSPSHKSFKPENLQTILVNRIDSGKATGTVIILDTVKKFTDLMSKQKTSLFTETVRQFISHGGTVVMLAHVNKHRGEDGKLIYAGTSDLVDDADCTYTLDLVHTDPTTGTRTVRFENFKSRGDVAMEAVYQYDYNPDVEYYGKLQSVVAVGEDEYAQAEKRRKNEEMVQEHQTAIGAIRKCIVDGITQKTALVNAARDLSDLSRKKLKAVLSAHTGRDASAGHLWYIAVGDKNTHNYRLIEDAGDPKSEGEDAGEHGDTGQGKKAGERIMRESSLSLFPPEEPTL